MRQLNVLISDQGRAQLCDFGLSQVFSELSKSFQTTTATPGFTTRYSAYEVIVEEVKTVKSDVYAFGCTCIHVSVSLRTMVSALTACLGIIRPTPFP